MLNSRAFRSVRMATWLGWQIESNWTDPFLFAIYSIIKPLAAAGILVVMYRVVSNQAFDTPIFAYLYLGNAFYQYVSAVTTGVSWAIIDDREHYLTLKYIYVAPLNIPLFLFGRGVARFLTSSFAVIVIILFGVWFLHMPLDWATVNWLLLLTSLVLGVVMLAFVGLILAGVTLMTARHSYYIGDVVAGALFLFTGAIFPLKVLPFYLRPIGYALPITYWLELMRRSLVGQVAQAFPTFTHLGDWQLLGILALMTLAVGVISLLVFRFCETRARERGLLDYTSNY
jgi:ABC-2 type transport system permease protein